MHGATTHPLFYPVECRTNDGGWETYVHDLNFPSDLDRFPPSPPPAPAPPPPPFGFRCIGDGTAGATCDPHGDWYAVSSAQLASLRGWPTDLECAKPTLSDDASGRATVSEAHTGTSQLCGNNHCGHVCGCDSAWVIGGTEEGGLLQMASKIRYRQVFSGGGNCFTSLGAGGYGATVANHKLATYTVDFSPRADNGFVPTSCGPNDPDCPGGVCTCDNQHNWWKFCGYGTDHTSVYVTEQRRANAVGAFGVETMNGVCGWYGSWRYEALEVFVLGFTHHPALNCHESGHAPAVTDVAMPAGLAYVTYAATTTDLLYDLTDTPHECMEACLSLPATGCNAIVYGSGEGMRGAAGCGCSPTGRTCKHVPGADHTGPRRVRARRRRRRADARAVRAGHGPVRGRTGLNATSVDPGIAREPLPRGDGGGKHRTARSARPTAWRRASRCAALYHRELRGWLVPDVHRHARHLRALGVRLHNSTTRT